MVNIHYTSLNHSQREFRLLHLLPRTQSCGDNFSNSMLAERHPITLVLEKTSLNNCPQYNALSYTWGDIRLTRQVLVDNKLIAITESLELALRHLQQERDTLMLWVDALCINQEDMDEKGQQVQQMTEIYHVGREYQEHDLAGITVGQMVEIMNNQDAGDNNVVKPSLNNLIQKLDYLFPDEFPINQYQEFVQRPWWYRVWVIQELCVAQTAIFVCGKKTISYNHLRNTSSFLKCYGCFRLQRIRSMGNLLNNEEMKRAQLMLDNSAADVMLSFRSQYQQQQPKDMHTLYFLLRTTIILNDTMRVKASDERDKIYALLGLASDKDKLGIRIAYSKDYTVREVYVDVSKALLKQGHLELLSLRQSDRTHSTFPSWVCNWSAEIKLPFGDATLIDRPFAASGSSAPKVDVSTSDDLNIAIIQGLQVDDIQKVGLLPSNATNQPEIDWNAVGIFVSDVELICGNCPAEDISRILLGDIEVYYDNKNPLPRRRRATTQSQEGYKSLKNWVSLLRQLEELNQWAAQHPSEINVVSARNAELNKGCEENDMHAASRFWSAMAASLARRPFRSTQGYVGLGPVDMQPGDIICVFFGSHLPHIIRPALAGRYQLVGEAYVHGIMDGEFMEEINSDKGFRREFELY